MPDTKQTQLEMHDPKRRHRDVRGGGARAAVFGISDGLVSNASLILGIDGAHPASTVVRLAGLAGLVGGALSMAAGEYVSMRAQTELFEHQIEVERAELRDHPEGELIELAKIYELRGLDPSMAEILAVKMMSTPESALATHAREELGIDPDELGSPIEAALSSFASFAVGALIPLTAFLFFGGLLAASLTVILSGLSAFGVGAALAYFTGKSWWRSALRQLLICLLAAAITFTLGSAIGLGVS